LGGQGTGHLNIPVGNDKSFESQFSFQDIRYQVFVPVHFFPVPAAVEAITVAT
jgi:hypothetical protein